VLVFIP